MKKSILILAVVLFSCTEKSVEVKGPSIPVVPEKEHHFKSVAYYKVIKDLKEVTTQKTAHHYQLDPLGKHLFSLQPSVYTETEYFVIYKDHSHDKVSREDWLNYAKGDSIQFTRQVMID